MRKSRDGEGTKEAVIAAAKEVFAEKGFAGTSLAMIAQKSGISDGLILHHFQSKKNLYHVVLNSLGEEYRKAISAAWTNSPNPAEASQNVLQATVQYWSTDRVYNRIALWAYLENQTELMEEETKITADLSAVLSQMQAAGQVDPTFSPFVLLTMTIGPIHFWTRYREQFKQALQLDSSLEGMNEVFLNEYIHLIQKMYQPPLDQI